MKFRIGFSYPAMAEEEPGHDEVIVESNEYVQITYESLTGGNGDVIAYYNCDAGLWVLVPEHLPKGVINEFSDIVIYPKE